MEPGSVGGGGGGGERGGRAGRDEAAGQPGAQPAPLHTSQHAGWPRPRSQADRSYSHKCSAYCISLQLGRPAATVHTKLHCVNCTVQWSHPVHPQYRPRRGGPGAAAEPRAGRHADRHHRQQARGGRHAGAGTEIEESNKTAQEMITVQICM